MRWQVGLSRISKVLWGLIGAWVLILGGVTGIGSIVQGEWLTGLGILLALAIGLGICVGGHKVTCWVIDGFFAPGSKKQ